MSVNTPRVSVVIPTYRRRERLRRAVDSVIEQTYGDWELHVVDDASGDRSMEVLDDIRDARLHRHILASNGGTAAARNEGIHHSRGSWIAFLDSDDVWYSDKLQRIIEVLDASPEKDIDIVAHRYVYDYVHELKWGRGRRRALPPSLVKIADIGDNCFFHCRDYQVSTWMVKAKCLRQLTFDVAYRNHEDLDFLMRCQRRGFHFYYLPEVLAYRGTTHGDRFSDGGNIDKSLAFIESHRAFLKPRVVAGFRSHILSWKYFRNKQVPEFLSNVGGFLFQENISARDRFFLFRSLTRANLNRTVRLVLKTIVNLGRKSGDREPGEISIN
jgi:glycosyltransferase involved in cell wall biosynthesis